MNSLIVKYRFQDHQNDVNNEYNSRINSSVMNLSLIKLQFLKIFGVDKNLYLYHDTFKAVISIRKFEVEISHTAAIVQLIPCL